MGALIRAKAQTEMPWAGRVPKVRPKLLPNGEPRPPLREMVLSKLRANPNGLTCGQLCAMLDETVEAIAPVLSRMKKREMVRRAGKLPNASGYIETVWVSA